MQSGPAGSRCGLALQGDVWAPRAMKCPNPHPSAAMLVPGWGKGPPRGGMCSCCKPPRRRKAPLEEKRGTGKPEKRCRGGTYTGGHTHLCTALLGDEEGAQNGHRNRGKPHSKGSPRLSSLYQMVCERHIQQQHTNSSASAPLKRDSGRILPSLLHPDRDAQRCTDSSPLFSWQAGTAASREL